jgi:4-diphosphocytidyl-2-C-methyl-D-erythritol kinase
MIFSAPAKVNLTLLITGKDKNDGYHYIRSVFDPVSLYDYIDIIPRSTPGITVNDAFGRLKIRPEKNLVFRAASMLQKASGARKGADITLYKYIPDGAGLGGGSSDAAAVLKGLNRLWGLKYSVKKLKKMAFQLGSDVPFFISCRRSMITGKGEKIRPINSKTGYWYVIITKKGIKISTPDAYKWFDLDNKLTLSQKSCIHNTRLMREPKNPLLHFQVFNDFEAPIFRRKKALKKVKETLLKCGNAAGAGMSGSGSSVFAVFGKRKDALACHRKSMKAFKGSFTCLAHSI